MSEVNEPAGRNGDERCVLISNFRNVGLTGPAKLILNRSTEPGRMGDLVFLIGPNNSGKSNILDAIESIVKGTEERDVPEGLKARPAPQVRLCRLSLGEGKRYSDEDVELESTLHAFLAGELDSEREIKAIENFVFSGNYNFTNFLYGIHRSRLHNTSREDMVNMLEQGCEKERGTAICRLLLDYKKVAPRRVNVSPWKLDGDPIKDKYRPYVKFEERTGLEQIRATVGEMTDDPDEFQLFLDFACNRYVRGEIVISDPQKQFRSLFAPHSSMYEEDINVLTRRELARMKNIVLRKGGSDEEKTLAFRAIHYIRTSCTDNAGNYVRGVSARNMSFYDPFSVPLPVYLPAKMGAEEESARSAVKVVRFEPNLKHDDSELRSGFEDLAPVVRNILGYVGIDREQILGLVNDYRSMGENPQILRGLEDGINAGMGPVNLLFNRLYANDSQAYAFKAYVSSEGIQIRLTKSSVPMVIANQSTGFKWFYDFFVTVICGHSLQPGDVVLMDEPASNIHVRGQVELRDMMKRYAVESQITFVMSTHSPFMVSCDYLDEVRIVYRDENGEAYIENNFQAFGDEEGRDKGVDQIDGILSALTVGRNVLRDPGSPLVFVEGISDYNYYTAFAKLLGEDWVSFLPVNGLNNRDLGRKLRGIERNPILLVDADESGYIVKRRYGGGRSPPGERIQVVTLEDVDGSFTGDYNIGNFNGRPEGSKGFCVEDLFSEKDRADILRGRKESDFSSVFKSYIDDYGPMLSEETKGNFSKVFHYLKQEFLMD